MSDWLTIAITAVSLLLAATAAVYVVRDRLTDGVLLALAVLLFAGALAQLAVGVVQLAGSTRDVPAATFVGYLLGVLVAPPLAAFWALGERSRAGTAVWIVAGLVVPFLELRLGQIWAGGPGG